MGQREAYMGDEPKDNGQEKREGGVHKNHHERELGWRSHSGVWS